MRVTAVEIKNLSVKEYINKIKPYLRDIIINLQKSGKWKVQLTIVSNSISSQDVDEKRVVHLDRDNSEFTTFDNANNVVDELFKSLLSRYQNNLETSIRGNTFLFHSVQLLYYKFHKTNFRRGGSYIDSPD